MNTLEQIKTGINKGGSQTRIVIKPPLNRYGICLTQPRAAVVFCSDGEDCVENNIPNFTGNAKTKLKVLIVMSKMVFLHGLHIGRELRVVQSVVHTVI